MKRILEQFWILLLLCYPSFAQTNYTEIGQPYITNYTPKETGGFVQNWSIVQNNEGVIYVGNGSGCLEYDGVTWRLISMPNLSVVRSLACSEDNVIYVGALGELGYLAPDSIGSTKFISLLDYVDEQYRNFEDVWSTLTAKNEVYFQTREYLFIWNNREMKVIKAETSFHFSSCINNTLYVRQRQIGLMRLNNGSLELVPDGDKLADQGFYGMLPFDGNKNLIFAKQGLFIFDGNSITPFQNQANSTIAESQLYHASILPDGNFAIATFYSGVFILSRSGELLYNLKKSSGILSDYVVFTFVDKQGALWLALNNGLSRVEIPSRFTRFTETSGIKGIVENILRHRGKLYAATSVGLFVLNSNTGKFTQVNLPGSTQTHECWSMLSIDDNMLLATNYRLYAIKGNQINTISDKYNMDFLYRSRIDPNRIYVGLSDGLAVFTYNNGRWRDEGRVDKVESSILQLAEDNNGFLWATSQFNGVYKIHVDSKKNPKDWETSHFGTDNGLPLLKENMAYNVGDRIVFATNSGLYRFNENTAAFERDTSFGAGLNDPQKKVFRFIEDNKGNIWCESEKSKVEFGIALLQNDGTYHYVTEQLNRLGEFIAQTIYPEPGGPTWFGGAEGIVKYDPKVERNYNAEFSSLVRAVSTIDGDSLIFGGYPDIKYENPLMEIEYDFNSLRFEFATTSYDNALNNTYQYYLQDFDKGWSDWTVETKKDYTNISEGTYIFRVRAKNIYGKLSSEGFYRFAVLPPWYRTWWSYCMYVILFGAFVYVIVRLRSAKLEKEKHQLERIVTERTAEVVKQKEELEKEKEKSDNLLYNILPVDVANELKEKGTTSSRRYEEISILFTDFKGFTNTVATMPAKKLVDELNEIFKHFDDIIDKYGLEKIKTIGDAYMIGGGLPKESHDHASKCIRAAAEMMQFIQERNKTSAIKWQMRAGIHSGAVIAGVVGKRKFTFDVWGDTVNIASRMESAGEPGRVNISAYTYDLVKNEFDCEYRGKIEIKGKGEVDMYFVK